MSLNEASAFKLSRSTAFKALSLFPYNLSRLVFILPCLRLKVTHAKPGIPTKTQSQYFQTTLAPLPRDKKCKYVSQ